MRFGGFNCPCYSPPFDDDENGNNPPMQTVTVVLEARIIDERSIELVPVDVQCHEPFNPLTVTPANTRLVTSLKWAGGVPSLAMVARFSSVINEVTQGAWVHYLNRVSPFVN